MEENLNTGLDDARDLLRYVGETDSAESQEAGAA